MPLRSILLSSMHHKSSKHSNTNLSQSNWSPPSFPPSLSPSIFFLSYYSGCHNAHKRLLRERAQKVRQKYRLALHYFSLSLSPHAHTHTHTHFLFLPLSLCLHLQKQWQCYPLCMVWHIFFSFSVCVGTV